VTQIQLLRDLITEALKLEMESRPLLSDSASLHQYLHHQMAFDPIEKMRVLFMNTKNRLISDEVLGLGTIDRVTLHIREVLARALNLNAASIILVHNHPSGDPTPSAADIDITRRVIHLGEMMNLKVIDHLIISKTGHYSLRAHNQI